MDFVEQIAVEAQNVFQIQTGEPSCRVYATGKGQLVLAGEHGAMEALVRVKRVNGEATPIIDIVGVEIPRVKGPGEGRTPGNGKLQTRFSNSTIGIEHIPT